MSSSVHLTLIVNISALDKDKDLVQSKRAQLITLAITKIELTLPAQLVVVNN